MGGRDPRHPRARLDDRRRGAAAERIVGSLGSPALRRGGGRLPRPRGPRRAPAGAGREAPGPGADGRAIHLLTLGTGPRRVLMWSQMHGDEPSATPALLDVADYLLSDAQGHAVLDALTLLMVPMLNPDGAERRVRRNAQGID